MNRLVILMAAAAFHSGVVAAADGGAGVNFAGDYRMQGKGFGRNDRPYEGTCSLSGDGPAYRVSCYNNETQHTYSGRGLANGDTLAINIGDYLQGDHGGVFVGEYLAVYRRKADGVLEGIWVHSSGAGGSESLTLLD